MPEALRAEALVTTDALERLEPAWWRLWRAVPSATPFQSPAWLLPWWRHIGQGGLLAFAVRDAGGTLVALAPWYVWRDPRDGVRHLFPLGIATSDDLDLLVQPAHEAAALRCIAAQLAECSNDWDVLEVPQLRPDASMLRLPVPPTWQRQVSEGEPSPALALPGSELQALVPADMARNLRQCRQRAARAGRIAYALAGEAEVPDCVDALVRLHGARWSARGEAGVLEADRVQACLREASPLLQRAGLLRLHALHLDGQPIAVLYALMDTTAGHARRCAYYIGGFDPAVRALSLGTLLVARAIEQAIDEDATAFDFLRGGEAYKYRWGAVDQRMFALRAVRWGSPGGSPPPYDRSL